MKTTYTHVSILLDRSGSMASIKEDTIGGFNTFIADQKKLPGDMTLTLAQFDDRYEHVYETVPIQAVQPLTNETFVPRGSTALLDATAKLIIDTGRHLAAMPETERPGKVLVVILTDGQENSSREQTRQSLSVMVKHQEEKYDWQFLYIGANQDAFAEGAAMGITGLNSRATGAGTKAVYSALSDNIGHVRAAPAGAAPEKMKQEDIDRREQ